MKGTSRDVRREWQRKNRKSWGGKHGQAPSFLQSRRENKKAKRR